MSETTTQDTGFSISGKGMERFKQDMNMVEINPEDFQDKKIRAIVKGFKAGTDIMKDVIMNLDNPYIVLRKSGKFYKVSRLRFLYNLGRFRLDVSQQARHHVSYANIYQYKVGNSLYTFITA